MASDPSRRTQAHELLDLWLDMADVRGTICRCNCPENQPAKDATKVAMDLFRQRVAELLKDSPVVSHTAPGLFRDMGVDCAGAIMLALREGLK